MPQCSLYPDHRLGDPPPRRIAILRAVQLGDLLCSVPAFRALRAALPEAEIVLIGLPWAREFVPRFSCYLDRFIEFPGFPGLPDRPAQLGRIPEFISAMQREHFDLIIQMQDSGEITNPLVMLMGAKRNAGFLLPEGYCPENRFLLYPEGLPEVRRHLQLMKFLGVPLQGEHLDFPLLESDQAELDTLLDSEHLLPGKYVCVHPGAQRPDRRWSAMEFAAVADTFNSWIPNVVLTGSAEEAELARTVAAAMKHPAINLAGKTSLGAMAALLSSARLLVCNDACVAHLAAALHVPSVVVITSSEPEPVGPLDQQLHRVVQSRDRVTPEQVVKQAVELIKNGFHAETNSNDQCSRLATRRTGRGGQEQTERIPGTLGNKSRCTRL